MGFGSSEYSRPPRHAGRRQLRPAPGLRGDRRLQSLPARRDRRTAAHQLRRAAPARRSELEPTRAHLRCGEAALAERRNSQSDLFAARPVQFKDEVFNDSDAADNVFGLYTTNQFVPWQETDLYWIYRDKGDAQPDLDPTNTNDPRGSWNGPAQRIHTVGTRWKSKPGALLGWDYLLEAAYQWGEVWASDRQLAGVRSSAPRPSPRRPATPLRRPRGNRASASNTTSPPATKIPRTASRSRSRISSLATMCSTDTSTPSAGATCTTCARS